jgi:antitoxin (DNA-binding transcriptional repressor) of toxin-antitoxin stability system
MTTATVRGLRYDFPSVLARVSKGESIAITKRGKVVAQISPPEKPGKSAYRAQFLARIQEAQRKAKPDNFVEWFIENRA